MDEQHIQKVIGEFTKRAIDAMAPRVALTGSPNWSSNAAGPAAP